MVPDALAFDHKEYAHGLGQEKAAFARVKTDKAEVGVASGVCELRLAGGDEGLGLPQSKRKHGDEDSQCDVRHESCRHLGNCSGRSAPAAYHQATLWTTAGKSTAYLPQGVQTGRAIATAVPE